MSAVWVSYVAIPVVIALGASGAGAATLYVTAGGDFQAALNAAQPGDEIVLEKGARFVGAFRLPGKPGGPAITIRSGSPLPDRRLKWPEDGPRLAIIASGTVEAALTGHGVSNWRLDGLRFESNTAGQGNVIELLDATNITMDRLIIVAGPDGQKRGILGNGRNITLTRSHIANIWATGQDSQAFLAYDGAGPYAITDNYLEAASENVMFGGADSAAPDRIPADILVENNHFSKQLEWKGQWKVVKNLFELKAAKRVVIRNNLFERNWTDVQSGSAIVFTPRNQGGLAPWSVVEDVLFERNIIRETEAVFNILGIDGEQPSGRTTRITIRNNLAIASRTFLMAGGEVGTLTIDHNTVDQGSNVMLLYCGNVWPTGSSQRRGAQYAIENLIYTNNMANHNEYGVFGDNTGIGLPALTRLTLGYTWRQNVLAGGANTLYRYPPGTFLPTLAEYQSQFTVGYTLAPNSVYRGIATDGTDLGAPGNLELRAPGKLRITG
jgi:hypothetical protein